MSDWLVEQLPRVLSADPFLRRFTRIFEVEIDRLRDQVDGLPHYLDPAVAPAEVVRWLGRWVGFDIDYAADDGASGDGEPPVAATWSELRQRNFVREAAPLFRYRGTKKGLTGMLDALIGEAGHVEMTDPGEITTSREFQTSLPEYPKEPIEVRITGDPGHSVRHLEALLTLEVPADRAFELVLADQGAGDG